jgi:hypothetical protein
VSSAFAQALPAKTLQHPEPGAEGLLVNSTVSANGQIFFLNFLDFWREKSGSSKYSIEVAERTSKRWGNQVWISYGQKRLFFSALPFKTDRLRALSEQAAEVSFAALISLSLPFSGTVDPDVAEDEI